MKYVFSLATCALLTCTACGAAQAGGSPASPSVEQVEAGQRSTSRAARVDLGFGISVPTTLGPGGMTAADYPVVSVVRPQSGAAEAGLAVGDVVLAVDGRDGRERGLFRHLEPGQRYVLRIRRGTEVLELTLVARPPRTRERAPAS